MERRASLSSRIARALIISGACAATTFLNSNPPAIADASSVTIFQSAPCVLAETNSSQHFADYVNLADGQDNIPLTLVIHNGTASAPGFSWIHIASPTMPGRYLTEQDCKQANTYSFDLTGQLGVGPNQIIIHGAGPKGAALSWSLTAPQVELLSAEPQIATAGENVSLIGRGFSSDPTGNVVKFNERMVRVVSASQDKLVVKVSPRMDAGTHTVTVSVGGVSAPTPLTVRIAKSVMLTGISAADAAPAHNVTIYGENFSTTPEDNIVFLGPFQAKVVSATSNNLVIEVPAAFNQLPPQNYQPVLVTSAGVKAHNKLLLSVSRPN